MEEVIFGALGGSDHGCRVYAENGDEQECVLQKGGKTVTNLSRKMYSFFKENENDSRCHSLYI